MDRQSRLGLPPAPSPRVRATGVPLRADQPAVALLLRLRPGRLPGTADWPVVNGYVVLRTHRRSQRLVARSLRVVQVAVNGKAQSIRRSTRKEGQVFIVSLGGDVKVGEPVTVSYTYRVL